MWLIQKRFFLPLALLLPVRHYLLLKMWDWQCNTSAFCLAVWKEDPLRRQPKEALPRLRSWPFCSMWLKSHINLQVNSAAGMNAEAATQSSGGQGSRAEEADENEGEADKEGVAPPRRRSNRRETWKTDVLCLYTAADVFGALPESKFLVESVTVAAVQCFAGHVLFRAQTSPC